MSDDSKKGAAETLTENATAAAVELYRDGLKPAVKPLGVVIGEAVQLVTWPLRQLLTSANGALNRLDGRLHKRLADVPPEKLLPPPATIAGPAVMQYALLGDSDDAADLRFMFENLLARSMHADTATDAHPAFVSMISQLSPVEARLLRAVTQSEFALLFVREARCGNDIAHGTLSLLCIDQGLDLVPATRALSNLDRLGILRMANGGSSRDYHAYERLQLIANTWFPDGGGLLEMGSLSVTALGIQFLGTCVGADASKLYPSRFG